jgi:hypothetical protein
VPVAVLESTVNVTVELPLPGAAIKVGLKPTVTPAGFPIAERVTSALNPFSAIVVTVEEFDPPCAALTAFGDAEIEKSGVTVTVRFTLVVRVTPAPMPVMVIGYVPGATVGPTVNVAAELPFPGAGIDVGLKPTVAPVGSPFADRAIAALKPLSVVVVIVEVLLDPCADVAAVPVMLKLAAGVTVRFTRVLWTVPPEVPVIVMG